MSRWTKQKYKITLGDKIEEVEGAVCGQWGIDKRDNQYYILTHVPTGYRVESGRTMKFLKDLVDTPEFECFDGHNTQPLADTISRFRNEYGWKK